MNTINGRFENAEVLDRKIQTALDSYLISLYLYGIPLPPEKEVYLRKKGLINSFNSKKTIPFDSNYRIFETNSNGLFSDSDLIINTDQVKEMSLRVAKDLAPNSSPSDVFITKEMWTPGGLKYDYENEFWNWINCINKGFQYYVDYGRFELYVKQAYAWINQNITWNPNASIETKKAYLLLERERMLQNSLYALNKFAYIKNDSSNNKYEAWKSQQIMLYLLDLTISYIMGKARQIGATTTIGAATGVKTMLTHNMYCKLVAQRTTKTEELFRDKVKYPIDKFPTYVTPSILGDSKEKLEFARKVEKGKTIGSNSIFEISSPTSDCINGGSPTITLLDEIGYFDNLSEIISEGRPTLLAYNPITGRQEFRRQVIGWGTGGEMDKGGAAMEAEYYAAKEAWMEKDYSHQIIPLFVNVFGRRGFTKQVYESEKISAYRRKSRPGEKDPKIYFHQSNPVTEEDMFLISSETIIPINIINKKLSDCQREKEKGTKLYKWGYFVPIYNKGNKYGPESDVPYEIIGAKFVPASEDEILNRSHKAGVCIINEPQRNWVNRYFQGNDPVFTSSGTSNMAVAVWDSLINDISAYIDFRIDDYRYCYLQAFLMKLYYSPIKSNRAIGIKELVESNVGGEYLNYNRDKKMMHTLVHQSKLPDTLQLGGVEIGINKRTKNAPFIINHLEEMLLLHLDSIHCDRFYEQLKTYVRKTTSQSVKWEAQNSKFHKDDIIDAVIYAYICAKSHKNLKPVCQTESSSAKYKHRYVYGPNGLELKKVRVNA